MADVIGSCRRVIGRVNRCISSVACRLAVSTVMMRVHSTEWMRMMRMHESNVTVLRVVVAPLATLHPAVVMADC